MFRSSTLFRRILTAAILLPPVLGIIWFGGFALVLLSLAFFLAINFEFISAVTNLKQLERIQLTLVSSLIPLGYLVYDFPGLLAGLLLAVFLILILLVLHVEREVHQVDLQSLLPSCFVLLGYPGLLGALLVVIASSVSGDLILWVLLSTILADTGAYFGGNSIGGQKLAERVSPNKTVSGAISGILACVIGGILLGHLLELGQSNLALAAYGILIGVLALFGDLGESLIKRSYGIKDTGSVLPGHGGVLDRVDALLFTFPVLFLYS